LLIKTLIQSMTAPGRQEIVVDFFAGSGSTGDALLAQNAMDGGERRFVLVQFPEPLDIEDKDQKTSAAYGNRHK
jgi:adenine-specific DNA-methyltransferase